MPRDRSRELIPLCPPRGVVVRSRRRRPGTGPFRAVPHVVVERRRTRRRAGSGCGRGAACSVSSLGLRGKQPSGECLRRERGFKSLISVSMAMADTDWLTRIDRLWTVIGRCYPIAYLYCHVPVSRKTSRERRWSPAGFGRSSNDGAGVGSGRRGRVHRRGRLERDAETNGGARLEVEPGSGADADR